MVLRTVPASEKDTIKVVASGTLPNGKPVIINSDGTASVVSATTVTETAGSAVVFETAACYALNGVYDSNANRVVFFYRDAGNTNYPTAVVGTVSGTSISFGTPVVVASVEQYADTIPAVFDSSANKIVFAYTDANFYGTAVVGTVSGTSISFGTPTVFDSSIYILDDAAMTYDSGNNKTVIVYQSYSRVGTLSGTTISFGTRTTFRATTVGDNGIAYDPVAGKVLVVYSVNAGSPTFQGEAIVGTVSGTTISFGSSSSFDAAGSVSAPTVGYHSASGQCIAVYSQGATAGYAIALTISGTSFTAGTRQAFDAGNTNYFSVVDHVASGKIVISYYNFGDSQVKAVSGAVSGAALSFDSPYVLNSAASNKTGSAYDSSAGVVAVAYMDGGNSNYGTSKVYRPGYLNSNLTARGYVGISSGGTAANGKSTAVDIAGTVNEDQSGLTPGQKYYVQLDGTLGSTPANPSVLAGTAVSATKILVKT